MSIPQIPDRNDTDEIVPKTFEVEAVIRFKVDSNSLPQAWNDAALYINTCLQDIDYLEISGVAGVYDEDS